MTQEDDESVDERIVRSGGGVPLLIVSFLQYCEPIGASFGIVNLTLSYKSALMDCVPVLTQGLGVSAVVDGTLRPPGFIE